MEHFPQVFWWSSRGWLGQLKGPQNEHEESGCISGIWKQLTTFTNWQMQELFVVATTLRPRRYRARYLECAIQGPIARQDADEAELARWIQVLADMLKATHTSMGQLLSTSTKLLGGGRTVSTVRSRVRVLRRFLSWLALNHQQVYPLSWLQLTEYLRVKLEEPCSQSWSEDTLTTPTVSWKRWLVCLQSSASRTPSYTTCSTRSCSPEPSLIALRSRP